MGHIWDAILRHMVKKTREDAGRNPTPSYGIIDSQSVETLGQVNSAALTAEKNKRRKTAYRRRHNGKLACCRCSCGKYPQYESGRVLTIE